MRGSLGLERDASEDIAPFEIAVRLALRGGQARRVLPKCRSDSHSWPRVLPLSRLPSQSPGLERQCRIALVVGNRVAFRSGFDHGVRFRCLSSHRFGLELPRLPSHPALSLFRLSLSIPSLVRTASHWLLFATRCVVLFLLPDWTAPLLSVGRDKRISGYAALPARSLWGTPISAKFSRSLFGPMVPEVLVPDTKSSSAFEPRVRRQPTRVDRDVQTL